MIFSQIKIFTLYYKNFVVLSFLLLLIYDFAVTVEAERVLEHNILFAYAGLKELKAVIALQMLILEAYALQMRMDRLVVT
jgi:hypothetical protein